MPETAKEEVLIRREGRAGRITMNRPQALNALTHAMVGPIFEALLTWRDDPGVELVVLDGSGERALCAGGDVRALYDSRSRGSGAARAFWRDEYRLNALIGRYSKPYVAVQDGIVMGGGIGLSATRVIGSSPSARGLPCRRRASAWFPMSGGAGCWRMPRGRRGSISASVAPR